MEEEFKTVLPPKKEAPEKTKCNLCSDSFIRLEDHIKNVHGKEYKCSHCDKTFALRGNLNIHFNTIHMGIKNFQCEYCEKHYILQKAPRCYSLKDNQEP